MKLKEYLDNINKLVEDNPSILDLDVVYSGDDEGNSYGMVGYTPLLGIYEDCEFTDAVQNPNSICIN